GRDRGRRVVLVLRLAGGVGPVPVAVLRSPVPAVVEGHDLGRTVGADGARTLSGRLRGTRRPPRGDCSGGQQGHQHQPDGSRMRRMALGHSSTGCQACSKRSASMSATSGKAAPKRLAHAGFTANTIWPLDAVGSRNLLPMGYATLLARR